MLSGDETMKIRKCVICEAFFEALSDKEDICRECAAYVDVKRIDLDDERDEDEEGEDEK